MRSRRISRITAWQKITIEKMNSIRIIGDAHGLVNQYAEIIKDGQKSICVGDFGFKTQWDWHKHNVDPSRHWINPGNHDYFPMFHEDFCLGNYSYLSWLGEMFTIRGAKSIDKHLRTEGIDWFANEELTYAEGLECLDLYSECKPRIVISHDAPQSVIEAMFKYAWMDKSNTTQLLQALFEVHQPEMWFFGHHHRSRQIELDGTKFRCLEELEFIDIEI